MGTMKKQVRAYLTIFDDMAILRLNINEKVLDKVLWLLSHFSKDEVEIVHEDETFLKNKKAIQAELDLMDQGKATFVSMDEFDKQVRNALANHET
ncbi:MAG: hypothetical protein Salg2KO_14750 [Salibacteraceae bacterium]